MSSNFLVMISREFVFSIWKHITINTNATTPRFMAPKSLFTHSINCYKSCCGSLAARSFQSERLNWTVTIDKRFSKASRRSMLDAMGMKTLWSCIYIAKTMVGNLGVMSSGRITRCPDFSIWAFELNCDDRQEIFRCETPLNAWWNGYEDCLKLHLNRLVG